MAFPCERTKLTTVTKISFNKPEFRSNNFEKRHRERPLLNAISQMSNEEIINASFNKANKSVKNSKAARAYKNWPLLFVAATSMVSGAFKTGKLTDKVLTTAKTGGMLLLGGTIASIAYKATANNKDKKPNLFNYLLNTAVLAGAAVLAGKGIQKAGKTVAKNFAPAVSELKTKIIEKADIVNSSKIGKISDKITENISNFANKHPKINKFAEPFGVLTASSAYIAGSSAVYNNLVDTRNKEAVANINKLALCRDFSEAALNK